MPAVSYMALTAPSSSSQRTIARRMRSRSASYREFGRETERSTPLRKSKTETPRATILPMSGIMFIDSGSAVRVLQTLARADRPGAELRHKSLYVPRSLGSRTSRKPSPNRLNPYTARERPSPGQIAIQGAWTK